MQDRSVSIEQLAEKSINTYSGNVDPSFMFAGYRLQGSGQPGAQLTLIRVEEHQPVSSSGSRCSLYTRMNNKDSFVCLSRFDISKPNQTKPYQNKSLGNGSDAPGVNVVHKKHMFINRESQKT